MILAKLKKYFRYFYLLVIKYRFYNHFFSLIFQKLKNVLTFYSIIRKEFKESQVSKMICEKNYTNNTNFFNNYADRSINLNFFTKQKETFKQQNPNSYHLNGPANLDLLYFCSHLVFAKEILETGVADGWSSITFLIYLENIQNRGKLTSIDMPYLDRPGDYKCGKIIPREFKNQWLLLVKPDSLALKDLKKESKKYDLVHYDSDKSIKGRQESYPKLWELLNNDGILISDDISDNMSFFNFCKSIEKKPIVIKYKNKFQGIIFK